MHSNKVNIIGGSAEKKDRLSLYKDLLINKVCAVAKLPRKDIENLFIKWIFTANVNSVLDEDLVPKSNIILDSDIQFLCKKYKKPFKKIIFHIDLPGDDVEESNIKIIEDITNETISLVGKKTFCITLIQYNRLKFIYNGAEKDFIKNCYKIVNIYNVLGGLSNLGSFPLHMLDTIDNINIVELFGSPLNTQYNYCSAFAMEKSLFNSLGSFFEYDLKEELYIANPPFDETLMELMANRLIQQLDNINKINVTIIIILPVWDPESQMKMNIKNYGTPFKAFDILKSSKYYIEGELLDSKQYPFYNYMQNKYVPYSHSHLIIFANNKPIINCKEVMELWRKCV